MSQRGSGRNPPLRASGRPGAVDTRVGGARGCYTVGWHPGKPDEVRQTRAMVPGNQGPEPRKSEHVEKKGSGEHVTLCSFCCVWSSQVPDY